ncbi:hypothetical protein [Cupriavidus sp.]|uniref:hypothetical protein n=1 Tax=Cupriavidus sp. TaxID=1873897 RepID=UPI0028BEA42A|nr:hypothetical protein [Cupriavidus sp.]
MITTSTYQPTDAEAEAYGKRPCLDVFRHLTADGFTKAICTAVDIQGEPLRKRMSALEVENGRLRAEIESMRVELRGLQAKAVGGAAFMIR